MFQYFSGLIELETTGGPTKMAQVVLVAENKNILEHVLILKSMIMEALIHQQQWILHHHQQQEILLLPLPKIQTQMRLAQMEKPQVTKEFVVSF